MSETARDRDTGSRDARGGPVLLVLVAKYRDLDIESAARLHSVSPQLARQLLATSSAVCGAVVLSTCSRFEIYCEVPPAGDVDTACSDALDSLCLCTGLPATLLSSLFERTHGEPATEHLFAVAAGLDSVVAGEREVAGQVRRALAGAQAAGTASGVLVRLFQAASRTGKDVGARTALSATSRSIASVALDLAAAGSASPPLSGVSVVLFGTGAYAACVAEILRSRRCSTISVFSQSGRAGAFVAARGGTALSARELPAAIARAGIIIGCSGAESRIGAARLAGWRRETDRPLTVIDLAPSHDFDPRVAELPGIELITLESVRLAAPPADAEALHLARALVRQAARRFEEREASRVVDTAIVALRRHVHEVLDAETERVAKQHGCGTAAEDVNLALRHIVRRLLHIPTVRAKELATAGRQDDYAAALEALFGLTVQPGTAGNSGIGAPPGPKQPPSAAGAAGTVRGTGRGGAGPAAGCPRTCPALHFTMRSRERVPAAPAASGRYA